MRQKRHNDSRHFAEMWKQIEKAKEAALQECDAAFRSQCGLCARSENKVKPALEREYRTLRAELRRECYFNEAAKNMLDGRKMGAIMCNALIKEKVFSFDEIQALDLLKKKKREHGDTLEGKVEFNRWAANNFFINYKVAYLFSLGLVVETAKEKLLRENTALGIKLNRKGWMTHYPTEQGMDSFNVSMVLGLGKADLKGEKPDMFMYALQLFQIEQYMLLALQFDI